MMVIATRLMDAIAFARSKQDGYVQLECHQYALQFVEMASICLEKLAMMAILILYLDVLEIALLLLLDGYALEVRCQQL